MWGSGAPNGVSGMMDRPRSKSGGLTSKTLDFGIPALFSQKPVEMDFLSSEIPRQPMLVHPDVSHALGVYCLTDSEIRELTSVVRCVCMGLVSGRQEQKYAPELKENQVA